MYRLVCVAGVYFNFCKGNLSYRYPLRLTQLYNSARKIQQPGPLLSLLTLWMSPFSLGGGGGIPHYLHHMTDESLLCGGVQLVAACRTLGTGEASQVPWMDHQAPRDHFLAQILTVNDIISVADPGHFGRSRDILALAGLKVWLRLQLR